jgi:hypothetical protein
MQGVDQQAWTMGSRRQDGRSRQLDVASALVRARRQEWWRTFSWLTAIVLVAVAARILAAETVVTSVVVAFGVLMILWSLRLVWGVTSALRDLRKAATPPRRAYVVVLHDANPRALRPLLGVWSDRPTAGQRLPKADRVYRCDDELDDLMSFQGHVRVHEAWVDTGRRPCSKPRWVAANDGIAVVHRRSLFGRWYFSMLTRRDRPGPSTPLTIVVVASPNPPAPEPSRPGQGVRSGIVWRILLLAFIAALMWWSI